MNPIDNIQQIIDMLGGSISDVSFCDEDLKHIESDFIRQNPDYVKQDISEEYKTMLENIKEDFTQFRKRTYVKTVFLYFEGILFAMKRIILEHSSELNDNDIMNLQEYKLIGPSPERLKEVPVWKSFEENVKYTFKKYAEIRTNKFKIKFDCPEWDNFRESIKIRNKVTHPKHSSDLIITDEILEKIRNAHAWFFKIARELQEQEVY